MNTEIHPAHAANRAAAAESLVWAAGRICADITFGYLTRLTIHDGAVEVLREARRDGFRLDELVRQSAMTRTPSEETMDMAIALATERAGR